MNGRPGFTVCQGREQRRGRPVGTAPRQQRPGGGGSPGQGRGVRKARWPQRLLLRQLLPCDPPPATAPQKPACSPASPSCPLEFNTGFILPAVLSGESRGMLKEHEISPCSSSQKSFLKAAFWTVAILSLCLHQGLAFSCGIEGPPGLTFFLQQRLCRQGSLLCWNALFLAPFVQSTGESAECSMGPIRASLGGSESEALRSPFLDFLPKATYPHSGTCREY